jgi:Ca-activated chloride channel homolog
MKPIRVVFTLCFAIFILISFVFSQDNTNKKDKNKTSTAIEIKVNLMVLTSDNKSDDDVKLEDVKIFEDGVEQKITYFKRKPLVLNIGLIFDNTGSMRDNLNEITAAGKTIVANLNSTDEAFVVRFTDSDTIETIQDWTSDKAALNEAIDNLFIEGGQSAVLDAIYLSAEKVLEREKIDKSKSYAIVLISDAEERDSYYKFEEVAKLFKETELQIFLLSYAENAPKQRKQARRLTNLIPFEIGGVSYSLPKKHNKDELVAALKSIVTELRSNYIVGYTSTNQNHDGLSRKLTVQVADDATGKPRQSILRENLMVPKN